MISLYTHLKPFRDMIRDISQYEHILMPFLSARMLAEGSNDLPNKPRISIPTIIP
jgi:hypothetical protein